MTKTLVLFVFHDYNYRVKHFINNCIFDDGNIDFIVISNNKNNVFTVPDNVKVLLRDNIGFDFGGWSDALLTDKLYENYDNFVFVNSSVMGPYIPSYCNINWVNIYINGLKDDVKLFGSTINTCGDPLTKSHVQSYIFSMDKITLQYLIDCEIFSMVNYSLTYEDTITDKEIAMSTKIIENGWNIGSLMSHYKNVDFTFKNKQPEEYNINFFHDTMWERFRNRLWSEWELVFIKGNRDVELHRI